MKLFDFAQQLKKSKGLTIATSIVKGNFLHSIEEINETKKVIFDRNFKIFKIIKTMFESI